MDDLRVGRLFRAARLDRRMRQVDLAARAGVSQSAVSRLESGWTELVSLHVQRRIAVVLGIRLELDPWLPGGGAAHLLDAGHAAMVQSVVGVLRRAGWDLAREFTINQLGERGSVVVLGWHGATGSLLVVEVEKRRVVPEAVAEQRGWQSALRRQAARGRADDGQSNDRRAARRDARRRLPGSSAPRARLAAPPGGPAAVPDSRVAPARNGVFATSGARACHAGALIRACRSADPAAPRPPGLVGCMRERERGHAGGERAADAPEERAVASARQEPGLSPKIV